MQREAYTIKEVAKSIGCHTDKIERLIRSGRLKAVNIGSALKPQYRIPKEFLDEFLKPQAYEPN